MSIRYKKRFALTLLVAIIIALSLMALIINTLTNSDLTSINSQLIFETNACDLHSSVLRFSSPPQSSRNTINIAISACGSHKLLYSTLTLIKSAIALQWYSLLSPSRPSRPSLSSSSSTSNAHKHPHLHFIIFTDCLHIKINNQIHKWPKNFLDAISFEMRSISVPNKQLWTNTSYNLCALQRLFLPDVLHEFDSVIYLDTDILFLTPIHQLHKYFFQFNSSQIIAMAPELDHQEYGWFRKNYESVQPLVGRSGVNSGVILMNLTRMREFGWKDKIEPMRDELNHLYGDQGIINAVMNAHQDKVFLLECRWNFCDEMCRYGPLCASANEHGVALLHHHYHDGTDRIKLIEQIFELFAGYELSNADIHHRLLLPLQLLVNQSTSSQCSHDKSLFVKSFKESISKI